MYESSYEHEECEHDIDSTLYFFSSANLSNSNTSCFATEYGIISVAIACIKVHEAKEGQGIMIAVVAQEGGY